MSTKKQLEIEVRELNATLALIHKADMRAIKRSLRERG